MAAVKRRWQTRIGLEIHAQLMTRSKLFSPSLHHGTLSPSPAASTPSMASPEDGVTMSPNTAISLFDIGYPGTLPRLNQYAVKQAIRTASYLNCTINKSSLFERKHYFYQDLPLGYQITQQERPIAHSGYLNYPIYDLKDPQQLLYHSKVNITRIQLEQDSGKSNHEKHPAYTLVDLNRAGVGLLEIVFAPDLQSSHEAISVIKTIQQFLRHTSICDGNLQDGSMRCDVNISLSELIDSSPDQEKKNGIVGNRVEIKNLNSLQRVSDAIEYEIQRHTKILESGEQVPRETRKFDVETSTTSRLRSKETAVDYRIFPDPDLPPLLLTDEEINDILTSETIETPEQTAARLAIKYELNHEQVNRLIASNGIRYYEETHENLSKRIRMSSHVNQVVYNWIFGDLMMNLNELGQTLETSAVTPTQMTEILLMILANDDLVTGSEGETEDSLAISGPQAKTLLRTLFHPTYHHVSPTELVIQNQWKLITDPLKIREFVLESVRNSKNSKQLKKYYGGNQGMVKFFFGDVMKLGKGQIDPKRIENVVIEVLEAEREKST